MTCRAPLIPSFHALAVSPDTHSLSDMVQVLICCLAVSARALINPTCENGAILTVRGLHLSKAIVLMRTCMYKGFKGHNVFSSHSRGFTA